MVSPAHTLPYPVAPHQKPELKQERHKNLVIDIRGNSGGKSSAPISLLSKIVDHPFSFVDSAYSKIKTPSFNKQLSWRTLRKIYYLFSTKRAPDKYAHKISGKKFSPSKSNNFDGNVYIITLGGTFSNAAIFATVAKRENSKVTVIGKEIGGNGKEMNGFMLPTLELPKSKIRIIFPLFRVHFNSAVIKIPDIEVNRELNGSSYSKSIYEAIKNLDTGSRD